MLLWATAAAISAATAAPPGAADAVVEPAYRRQSIRLSSAQMLQIAASAQERGDTAMAETAFLALADDPNVEVRIEALFRHGKMLVEAGRFNEGALLLRQVVDARP